MMEKFAYFNLNPKKQQEEDCVCRAISLGCGLPYEATKNLLNLMADYYECDTLCVCCYHHLLENIFGYDVVYCANGECVRDIASLYKNGTVIIRVTGHLTCAVRGVVYDIWDCTEETVDCYWIVK